MTQQFTKQFTKQFFTKLTFTICLTLSSLVVLWQKTSFLRSIFGFSQCRFYPSCSSYFLEAIRRHGLRTGFMLLLKRLIKCHPLCDGGVDEVPS